MTHAATSKISFSGTGNRTWALRETRQIAFQWNPIRKTYSHSSTAGSWQKTANKTNTSVYTPLYSQEMVPKHLHCAHKDASSRANQACQQVFPSRVGAVSQVNFICSQHHPSFLPSLCALNPSTERECKQTAHPAASPWQHIYMRTGSEEEAHSNCWLGPFARLYNRSRFGGPLTAT